MRRLLVCAAIALGGCNLIVAGLAKDEGRPCKDGRCPTGFVCQDARCVRVGGGDGGPDGGTTCSEAAECTECLPGTTPVCGNGHCLCVQLQGRFATLADAPPRGTFDLENGRLGDQICVERSLGADTVTLCGGIVQ
ncbi:MAG: hypothetical protein D6729_05140 [Deltaproteobacteria bacterium]|nr:MAG: hypothetical protein D6729_05140 [Deltaproteobacteria bacterium]